MANKPIKGKPATAAKAAPAKAVKSKAEAKEETIAKLKAYAKKYNVTVTGWAPQTLYQFVVGQRTLANLHGLSKEKLYEMATVGHNLMNQGRFPEAKSIFSGLACLDPYDAYFVLSLGAIAQRTNNLPEAEAYYSRAIAINNGVINAYANRGEVRLLLGQFAEAIQDFAKAISMDPDGKDPASMRCRVMMVAIQHRIQQLGQASGPAAATQAKP